MSRYGSDWCRYARVQVLCQASAACLDSANTADVNRDAQRLRNGSCASPRRGGACACDRSLHIFERGRPSVAANESYGAQFDRFLYFGFAYRKRATQLAGTHRELCMPRGFHLARIAGIDVYLDWSLAIVFMLVTFSLGGVAFPTWHPDWGAGTVWLTAATAAVLFFASVL